MVMFVSLTLGDCQFSPAAAVRRLLQWFDLRSAGSEHEDALAAVVVRASFEYMFADRFTGAGWTFPEQLFKDVIRGAAEGKEASKIADDISIAPEHSRPKNEMERGW
ncbi:hypothetical protein [Bradyrhizobium sp. CCBAU 51627]|uniref:hypothetical protein n=1 Tax=Bradyrhizobium sp. CCBAU 51627 TaxID=1325088 RepID=UPI0023056437|nr:hypothetical protein [Bradyrhizobium sp. CCBAU 51627]